MNDGGDTPLGGKGEAEWARLARTIDLASKFWLGFVFSPCAEDALVLRRRAEALLSANGRALSPILCDRPESLLETLPALLVDPALAAAGCVWIEAVYADPTGAQGGPWAKGWIELFLRANERRDLLRRRLVGGLVFAATPHIKPSVRDAAPDLWSVRTLVLELEPVPRASPAPRTWTPPLLRATRDNLAPDPAFALAEAERRAAQGDNVASGRALVQAASGLLAAGLVAGAKAAAQRARDLLHGISPFDESSTLALRAQAELAEGSLLPAADHIAAAISLRVVRDPLMVPIEWHDLSATISLAALEPGRARASYERAIAAAHEQAASVDSTEALQDLAVLLERRAAMERDLLEFDAARADLEEAVELWRRSDQRGEFTEDLRDVHELAGALDALAEVYQQMGEGALSHSASSEMVGLRGGPAAGDAPGQTAPEHHESLAPEGHHPYRNLRSRIERLTAPLGERSIAAARVAARKAPTDAERPAAARAAQLAFEFQYPGSLAQARQIEINTGRRGTSIQTPEPPGVSNDEGQEASTVAEGEMP